MRQHRFLASSIALALCCLAGSSSAQTLSRYTVGVMLGYGGSIGSGPSSSDSVYLVEDNYSLATQLFFGMEIRDDTLFAVRLGQVDVAIASAPRLAQFGRPVESELTYFTLAGEYRLPASTYQSGLFMGLGYYSVDGKGVFDDDRALGLTMGTTGDFRLNDRWSVMVEFAGHYADLEYTQFFIMGHAGFAVHF